jgi:geranylgeranyl reductase family protein
MRKEDSMFDVAVIGAGPSGSMLSRLLAEQGYSVALLEEHEQPGHPVNCSGIIGFEAFQRYDLPRTPIIREIDSFQFHSPGGATLRYQHPHTLAFAVNRAKFDVCMAEQAVSAGATLMTSSRVNEILIRNDGVDLHINRNSSTLKSKLLVIATGAGSKLIKQVGLGSFQQYVFGAQTECVTISLKDVEIYFGQDISPFNFAWIIPLEMGRAKIGLICERNATDSLKRFIANAEQAGKVFPGNTAIQNSLLPLNTIQRSYTNRTIVVGEAAGQLKTITCGGIYYGLLAAEIGADVLGKALREKNFGANALSMYQHRWKKLLGKELQIGSRLRSTFRNLSDTQIDTLFEIAGKDGLIKLIRERANFDWHYDLISSVFRHSLTRAIFKPITYSRLLF